MSKVVDLHAHILPASAMAAGEEGTEWHGSLIEHDDLGNPIIVTGHRREGMGGKAHYEPMTQRIERMDEAGVDVQVLSVNPIFYRHYLPAEHGISASTIINDEIAGFAAEWPDRFAGYAALPAQDPDRAVQELERVMKMPGMVGASLGTHVGGVNWDEPELFPILEAAQDLGALLFFHPSDRRLEQFVPRYHLHNSIGNPAETTIAIGSLIYGGVLDRLPDLRMLFAHGGGYACWAGPRFDHGYKVRREAQGGTETFPSEYLERMWYDSLVHGYVNLRHLIDEVGIERVVLGTDFPADMGQPDPVAWIQGSDLSEAEQTAVLAENAAVLLDLPVD